METTIIFTRDELPRGTSISRVEDLRNQQVGEENKKKKIANYHKRHDHDQRVRDQKVAKKNQLHAKPPCDGKHGKVQFGPPETQTQAASAQLGDNPFSVLADGEEGGDEPQQAAEPPPPPTVYVVVGDGFQADNPAQLYEAVNGRLLTYLPNNYVLIHKSNMDHDVAECGVSVYTLHGEKRNKVNTCLPLVERLTIGAYRAFDDSLQHSELRVSVAAAEYAVHNPFLATLRRKFKHCRSDENTIKAVWAFVSTSDHPTHPLIVSTTQYFLAVLRKKYYAVIESVHGMRRTNNGEAVVLCEEQMFELSRIGQQQRYDAPIIVNSVECDLPFDWPVRGDVTVDGVPLVDLGRGYDHPMFALDFESAKDNTSQHRTLFFSFVGDQGEHFSEYRSSPNNMRAGMKRLLGARPNERAYRLRALSLGTVLKDRLVDMYLSRNIPLDVAAGTDYHSSNTNSYHAAALQDIYLTMLGERDGFFADHSPDIDLSPSEKSIQGDVAQSMIEFMNRDMRPAVIDLAVSKAKDWVYSSLSTGLSWLASSTDSRWMAANVRHVKRALRRHYVERCPLHEDADIMVRALKACVKREQGKFGKAPRIFVGYDAGAMYANELPEFVKVNLDGHFVFNIRHADRVLNLGVHIMAKPKPGQLDEIFTDLADTLDMSECLTAAIYSDDMVVSGNYTTSQGERVRFLYNVDISSNDSSQDIPAFLAVFELLSRFNIERARGLIEQCMLPIRAGGHVIKFQGPFEGSGTVLTTSLNHLGSLMIVFAIAHTIVREVKESPADAIVFGASLVGHCVTVQDCSCNMHNVQFLKRSPYRVDGKWRAYTNLGCYLRSLGCVEDDLDARQLGVSPAAFQSMSHAERCDRFVSSVVAGLVWEPSNPIIDALRRRFPGGTASEQPDWTPRFDGRDSSNTEAIMARYGLSSSEIEKLVQQIDLLRVGDVCPSSAVAKIFSVDYGVLRGEE